MQFYSTHGITACSFTLLRESQHAVLYYIRNSCMHSYTLYSGAPFVQSYSNKRIPACSILLYIGNPCMQSCSTQGIPVCICILHRESLHCMQSYSTQGIPACSWILHRESLHAFLCTLLRDSLHAVVI